MPSDWEDNDIEENVVVAVPATKKKWDDEDEDDDNVKDSWDASDSEEEVKPAAPPPPKKKPAAQRIAEKKEEEKKKKELAEKKAQEEVEDSASRKERLRRLELEADMANTNDLFAGIKVRGDQSKSVYEMAPKNKEQFDEFQAALVEVISQHQNQGFYPTFLEGLFRDLAQPQTDIYVRKFSSTLTALANEKQKQNREAQQKKKKGAPKPILGGGGLKSATKGDIDYDGTVYEDEFDDFM